MLLCSKCGKANSPLATRCIECGQPLTPANPVATPQPPPYTPPPMGNAPVVPPPSPPQYTQPGYQFPPVPAPQAPYPTPPAGAAPPRHYYTPAGAPLPYAPASTTYYCLVCGAPLPGMGYAYCPQCLTPVGTIANPNDPTATTFLSLADVQRMNPAPRQASSVLPTGIPAMPLPRQVGVVPEDPKQGWNWGAALLTTPWAFRHRVWWAAILGGLNLLFWLFFLWVGITTAGTSSASSSSDDSSLAVGIAVILLSGIFWVFKTIYLGMNGNGLAWNSGLYRDATQMRKAQGIWAGWGVMISILSVIVFFVIVAIRS